LQRFGLSTAYGLSLPPRRCDSTFEASTQATSIWPAIRSWTMAAAPRYGTNWNWMPSLLAKSEAQTLAGPPTPTQPSDTPLGWALRYAINSLKSFGPKSSRVTNSIGAEVSMAIGARSGSRSNDRL